MKQALFVLCGGMWLLPFALEAKQIFVNGIDVTGAREQYLEGVNVRIDQEGRIYIEAPQYQVLSEHHYKPLKTASEPSAIRHKPLGESPFQELGAPPSLEPLSSRVPEPKTPAKSPDIPPPITSPQGAKVD